MKYASAASGKKVSQGDISFGFDLMSKLGNGNISISPYSIRTALSMLLEGARGESAQEITRVTRLPREEVTRQAGFKELIATLNEKSDAYTLQTANGLWVEKTFPMEKKFRDILTSSYQAEASMADFMYQSESERHKINKWVYEQTKEKIKNLFPQDSINDQTVVALANALYFAGFWQDKFNPAHTHKQDFTLPNSSVVKVDMMRKGEIERASQRNRDQKLPKFEYIEADGTQIVMLPYKGEALGKMVMLPPKSSNVRVLESYLQEKPELFGKWLKDLFMSKVSLPSFARLELPKHKIEGSYSLVSPLQKLGLQRIFSPASAELQGIGKGHLFVSAVQHKTYFKSDEAGSEGAAATGIGMRLTSLPLPPPKPVEFVADRPFLEVIVHRATNSVLFLNRVEDPR